MLSFPSFLEVDVNNNLPFFVRDVARPVLLWTPRYFENSTGNDEPTAWKPPHNPHVYKHSMYVPDAFRST